MIGEAACAEAELEHHGRTEGDASLGDQWSNRCCDDRLGESSEDAGVGELCGTRHLVVAAPGVFSCIEVESILVAEQRDEFEASFGVDDLE